MLTTTYPHWLYDGSAIDDPLGFGERAVEFFRRLKHPKSRLPNKSFQLDPWQERIVRRIYGPRKLDGSRIVSTVVMLLPRGNRKTSFAAALALLHTIGPEKVVNGEAIFAASDRQQAGIGFKEALGIVQAEPKVLSKLKVYDAHNSAKKIVYPRGATLEVIASEAGGQHGRTPAFVLADELHVWPNKYLWEALTTGLDKLDDPLLIVATTAGRGQENIAWEIVENARKVARGEIDDPSILPVLFEADPKCDYADENVWRSVNPGSAHGYPSIEGFRRHVRRAKNSPSERDSLRQLKLNIWLENSTSPFVDMAIYDEGSAPVDPEVWRGQPCWIGVDVSKTTDLTAVVACFRQDDGFVVLPQFFCPEDNILARSERDGVNYVEWGKEKLITPTPGNVIDYVMVADAIIALCERYEVREIGIDVTYAQAIIAILTERGLPVVILQQGWKTQSPALSELERAIIGRKFHHGGHKVLRWNFSNVVIYTDSNENRTIHKGKSTDRVDGASATWMAVSRAAAGNSNLSFLNDPNVTPEDMVLP
ncbi:terminase large subunit [Tardiphaga sp. vice304]|uniref:terminase large subunit n=1 Tax=Tardiphaga sp. vice304 TaxID=2592817 RepID=UPI0011622278|nr:terminase TerL endonuclease subunit [Tardiphaga sp. vice304]QDM27566.1 terminase large subunit [Tardiphaga sp. vice304]